MNNKYLSLLFDRKIEEAEKYRKTTIPKKLIKFFSLSSDETSNEKKLATLAEEKLWFSSVDMLNDPYEFKCMYINAERLEQRDYPTELIDFFKRLIGEELHKFSVVSLSGNTVDNLPMWAYYTNSYEGYCVEYDVICPDAIFQISYEPQRVPIAVIIAQLYNEFGKMRERGEKTNPEIEFYATILRQQLFMKHDSWRHEKEYRIVYPNIGSKGILVPIRNVGLKTSRIIAGMNCSGEHIERLKEIASNLNCEPLYQTKISDSSFTLLEEK